MADETKQEPQEREAKAQLRKVNRNLAATATENTNERNKELTANLKEFGIDTDRMTEAANERVGDLQQMLMDEVRARPMLALCWAATIGLFVGFLAAR
ncbi:hypothetical protein [Bosea sp. F3-2]|uniref:hypothetical protein n=1 Tax=Bosea sp. F3-2 TaxID=2599640 RepID=UPI001654EEB6|nr:hypothetical protein [Bosea sp. F3-2]